MKYILLCLLLIGCSFDVNDQDKKLIDCICSSIGEKTLFISVHYIQNELSYSCTNLGNTYEIPRDTYCNINMVNNAK